MCAVPVQNVCFAILEKLNVLHYIKVFASIGGLGGLFLLSHAIVD